MKLKKIAKTIGNILGYVVMAVLIAITAFVMISNARGEVPFLGKYSVMWVLTESMEPEIPARSNILIEKADPSTLEVGDIIVFISDDPSIKGSRNTHRIVEIIGDHEEFVTKGDHNVIADQVNARAENVVGKVVRTLPVLTRFSRLLTAPTGLVMMIAFILVILMVMYLPDMKKATEDTEKEVKAEHDKMIDEMVAKQVEYLKSLDAKKPADTEEKTE